MLIVHSQHQLAHRPGSFLSAGSPRAHPDIPERLDALKSGVDTNRHAMIEPRDHGERYVRLVHTERYLEFLREAHAAWRRLAAGSEAVIPNVHPRRLTKDNYPSSIVGRAGYHLYDMSCPIMEATWPAVLWNSHCAAEAALRVVEGSSASAYAMCRPPGHHAGADYAGGFCYLNNAAIAASILRQGFARVAVLDVDWAQWCSELRLGPNPPLIADLCRAPVGAPTVGAANGREPGLKDALRRAGTEERRRLIESYLRDQTAGKLGLEPSRLDVEAPLNRLGVDSLIAVELRTQIERDLGIVVPVVQLLDGPSVARLADWLDERLSGADPGQPEPTEAAEARATPPDGVPAPQENGVAGSRWIDLLAQVPEVSDDDVDELLREVLAAREGQDER